MHDTTKDPRYIASHPDIRSEVAVPLIVQDRVVGVMDLESDRVGYFTDDHVRTLALLAPQVASSVENARLYQELALREKAHGRGSAGGARIAARAAARRRSGDRGHGGRGAPAAGARDFGRHLRYLRASRRADRDRVRRRQRQGRRRGALRRPDERPAAHPGAAPPPSGRAAAGAERSPHRAQSGGALRHAVRAAVGSGDAPDRDGQCRRHPAHDLPREPRF